ncbi:hypothetical protein R1flu_016977 [Riccia fluitans]|uniref:Uncharacterized protein n=1 Tax=Riccia fluitans TaxID=41844 RepID=A0ABD1YNE4_9MARC
MDRDDNSTADPDYSGQDYYTRGNDDPGYDDHQQQNNSGPPQQEDGGGGEYHRDPSQGSGRGAPVPRNPPPPHFPNNPNVRPQPHGSYDPNSHPQPSYKPSPRHYSNRPHSPNPYPPSKPNMNPPPPPPVYPPQKRDQVPPPPQPNYEEYGPPPNDGQFSPHYGADPGGQGKEQPNYDYYPPGPPPQPKYEEYGPPPNGSQFPRDSADPRGQGMNYDGYAPPRPHPVAPPVAPPPFGPVAIHQAMIRPDIGPPVPWASDIFGFVDDCYGVPLLLFAPCITFGQIAEIVDTGYNTCHTAGIIYALALSLGIPCLYSYTYRTKMRHRFNLREDPLDDFCTHFWCECCALAQEYRELRYRGIHPSLGFDMQRDIIMSAMQAPVPPQMRRPGL